MLGELDEKQIDELLKRQITGRLGCHADGVTYVVPINYFYKNGIVYAHSGPGRKIDMMRKNPQVCFQVDEMESIFRWKSVITWGVFEEITQVDEQQQAMQGIIHRIMPFVESPAGHPSHGITPNESDIGTQIDVIVYRIRLVTKTGRFEQG